MSNVLISITLIIAFSQKLFDFRSPKRRKVNYPNLQRKRQEKMNKLPQQKTDDQKLARLKQASERLHCS